MEEIRAHDLIGGCCRQDRDIEHFHDEQKGQGDQEYLETVSKQDSGVMSSFQYRYEQWQAAIPKFDNKRDIRILSTRHDPPGHNEA